MSSMNDFISGENVGANDELLLRQLKQQKQNSFMNQTIQEIKNQYGHTVNLKSKILKKFGKNPSLNASTYETIWETGGNETYVSGNNIDTVSSSNTGDNQSVVIEGHTISGSELSFAIQTVTLNGQNKVVLTTPLYRVSRLYNDDTTDFAGDIYVYEDDTISGGVPTTTSKIHMKVIGSQNQSEKASTSTSNKDYLIVTSVFGSCSVKSANAVEFNLQVRLFGKVFRSIYTWSASSDASTVFISFQPYLIVPPNSDIRIVGISASGTPTALAGFNGVFALKE